MFWVCPKLDTPPVSVDTRVETMRLDTGVSVRTGLRTGALAVTGNLLQILRRVGHSQTDGLENYPARR